MQSYALTTQRIGRDINNLFLIEKQLYTILIILKILIWID